MTLSKKDLESIICIVCSKRYGEHTKGNSPKFSLRELMTCMFRIQGTLVGDGINNAKVDPPTEKLERCNCNHKESI
jgi:hypothetical protein